MRKLLFTLSLIALSSCSKDDDSNSTDDCQCAKVKYNLTYNQDDYPAGPTDEDLTRTGSSYYGDDCSEDGKILFNTNQKNGDGTSTIIKHKVECNN